MSVDDDITPTYQYNTGDVIFIVVEKDGTGLAIHAAYRHGGFADVHASAVGGSTISVQMLDRVPQSVIDRRVEDFKDRPTVSMTKADMLKLLPKPSKPR